jgi:hypothetical protein
MASSSSTSRFSTWNAAAAGLAGLCCCLALAACTSQVDLSAIDAERLKPLQRYDIVQALAANGEVVVGASQAGTTAVLQDGNLHDRTILPTYSCDGTDFWVRVTL